MAAAPPLSKAEYLKRYLSRADAGVHGGSESMLKRRKKRLKPGGAGGKGMRIVDDDVSWTSISTTKPEKEEEEDDGDLPVVAEFVDERPEEVKQMETFRSSAKWKLLGGQNEDLPSLRHFHHDCPDSSPPRRVRHDTPDPSPPRRVRHDTPDPSPPRRVCHDTPDPSPPRRVRHDTPDPSPPRRVRHDTPDPSPPRRVRQDTPDPSPPRRVRHDTPDSSPPRRPRHGSPDPSALRKHYRPSGVSPRRVHYGSSDLSPRRRACNSSPDTSQPKRTLDSLDSSQLRRAHHDNPDLAPDVPHSLPRTKSSKALEKASSKSSPHWKGPGPSHPSVLKNSKYEYDLDLSPPRKKQAKFHFRNKEHDSKGFSPSHRKFHTSSSPRRHQSHTLDSSSYPSDSRKASDSDLSPPRNKQRSGQQDSDSDLSPPRNRPRHQSSDSDLSPPRRKQRAKSSDSDLSPPRRTQPLGTKAAHMYSGAKTGLVLTDIQREQQELKKRDQETMAFEAEFQHAETVFRDKSGRKRDLKLERLEQRRKAEKDSERDELYAQWGKGLVQSRQQQQNVEDAIKEMQKPLARYIDDEDLDRMLREQEREGDPMANFIKKNKAKENKNKKVRPRYSGPAPPPNRFNIWPGYRWDGVDRSNGFEQKRFARLASKKAVEELAYKWSVEDM
ncbi:BUD13 homolog [Pteronotus mesoamericanus]|uniref:BUD13 homolog n=1 Tax=Pteronotus mesoamericanus TaxID=1884717 RepID=UPI0023ECA596|nr:BUD13 homolog [Pteronotus parnellii mesoamericanus]